MDAYVRKTFPVQAKRVTSANMEEVAELCDGHIQHGLKGKFIEVPVKKVLDVSQKHAHVGDWVLNYQGGWKVYNNRAFRASFDQVHESSKTAGEALDGLANIFQSSGQVTDEDLRTLQHTVNPRDMRGSRPRAWGR